MVKNYVIDNNKEVLFYNGTDYCVGTGRMGLALQKEYQDQLALVQNEIGFSYIRGHGLFSDDMGIYKEYEDENGEIHAEYCFTYLDLVMDSYLEKGIRPFLELGFMPEKLASGDQTIFYWKGNVTPPKTYEGWCEMVQATLRHFLERYGEDALTWPIEVWNEPNLPGFWKDADMEEYFKLFERTFYAIKEVHPNFRVGGPAICGVDDVRWMQCFMEFCHEHKIPLDFVTRHHYTTEVPERVGHYGYAELTDAEEGLQVLQKSREIIDSFEEYKGLEMHITEFNTSYIPNCPLHDTNQNAAYIAKLLSRMGDMNESYSYWTFGDIFEEFGVPFTPFHGGFGLVANGGIPKPTFWSFQFFKKLNGVCRQRGDNSVIVQREDGSYAGVVWNYSMKRTGEDLKISWKFPAECGKEYALLTRIVDEETCNPLKVWHDLGEPASLTEEQKYLLKESARPLVKTERMQAAEQFVEVELDVKEHGVIFFELKKISTESDRGYCYERVMQRM